MKSASKLLQESISEKWMELSSGGGECKEGTDLRNILEAKLSRQGHLIKWQGEKENSDGCFWSFESERMREKKHHFSKS